MLLFTSQHFVYTAEKKGQDFLCLLLLGFCETFAMLPMAKSSERAKFEISSAISQNHLDFISTSIHTVQFGDLLDLQFEWIRASLISLQIDSLGPIRVRKGQVTIFWTKLRPYHTNGQNVGQFSYTLFHPFKRCCQQQKIRTFIRCMFVCVDFDSPSRSIYAMTKCLCSLCAAFAIIFIVNNNKKNALFAVCSFTHVYPYIRTRARSLCICHFVSHFHSRWLSHTAFIFGYFVRMPHTHTHTVSQKAKMKPKYIKMNCASSFIRERQNKQSPKCCARMQWVDNKKITFTSSSLTLPF